VQFSLKKLFLFLVMQNQKLHVVSFDNPFPPKYGGVIDVFYKIKALYQLGIEITLHCFIDEIPNQNPELECITKKIFYYKREKNIWKFFSKVPFSVISRNHGHLLKNLNLDTNPILFEGLQTTYLLKKQKFLERKLYLRLHNIEENYYQGLSKSETNFFKKVVCYLESVKYHHYQKIIGKFDAVFTLSNYETQFILENFKKGNYIPVFHGNDSLINLSEFGNYAFYNGDLRIADNKRAVEFLINVFKKIPDYKLIIASSINLKIVRRQFKQMNNVEFIELESQSHLDVMLENAHINVMFSFQQAGTKLKVINALYKSRFSIINSNMLDDIDLKNLCILAENETEFVSAVNSVKNKSYFDFENRGIILERILSDTQNAKKMVKIIYS
jgi:hypothetical protein